MRTKPPLYPPPRRQHRETEPTTRSERFCADVRCVLLVDGAEEQVFLENYTARGFRVRGARRLFVGSTVSIVLPGCHPVEAVVRWSLGSSTGCLFRIPVNASLIRSAVADEAEAIAGR